MVDPFVTFALGALAGLVGSMPPGPLSLALLDRGRSRLAFGWWAGLDRTIAHMGVCISIGIGMAASAFPLLQTRWGALAVSTASVGFGVLLLTSLRSLYANDDLGDAIPGLRNRLLIAHWSAVLVLFSSLAIATPQLSTTSIFASGVAVGTVTWLAVLAIFGRWVSDERRMLRGLTRFSGLLLAAAGAGRLAFAP